MKVLFRPLLLCFLFLATAAFSAPLRGSIQALPPALRTGGMPLWNALAQRHSGRNFSTVPLTQQELSQLLWAGFGLNRADGRRTAPSALNKQEIRLYAILDTGAYKYLPEAHSLQKVTQEDLRPLCGGNVTAPAYILLVPEAERGANPATSGVNAGFIAQNIYLAAEAQKLICCALGGFRGNAANFASLCQKLSLPETDQPLLSMAVGQPVRQ